MGTPTRLFPFLTAFWVVFMSLHIKSVLLPKPSFPLESKMLQFVVAHLKVPAGSPGVLRLCCNEVFLVPLEPSGEGPVTGYYPARHRNVTAFPLNVLTFLVIEVYLLLGKNVPNSTAKEEKCVKVKEVADKVGH